TGDPVMPILEDGYEITRLVPLDFPSVLTSTHSLNLAARLWEMPPDNRTVADWDLLAKLLAGRQLDATGALVPVERTALATLWNTVRDKYLTDVKSSSALVLAWH